MRKIEIRPISENDIEGFHACFDAVARERKFIGLLTAPSMEKTRKWLMDAIEREEIRLVAVDESKIIGWCDIETNDREGFSHSGRLGMGILKEYRGQGIGTKLIEEILSTAIAGHLERVELDVYASNSTAMKLYEKFRFQVEGRKRHARKLDGAYDDILVMALLLGYEN